VGDKSFHIAVNGRKYCDYNFRCPLEDIRTITVHKDVQLINQVDHRQAYPSPFPQIQSEDRKNVFSNDVPKPFLPGQVLIITALPFGNPKGMFTLRFTEGDTKKQALHFNVRFHPHNMVVRNSMNDALE
jgi:Galactoside-binding lectin